MITTHSSGTDSIDQYWRSATQGSGLGIWAWRFDSNRVLCSESWLQTFGKDDHLSEPSTDDFWQRSCHSDTARLRAEIKRIRDGDEQHIQVENRIRHADGSWRTITRRLNPIRDEHGRVVGVTGCDIDITEERRRLDNLPIGVFHMDCDANCDWVTSHWQHVTGYSPEEGMGRNWLSTLPRGYREFALKHFQSVVRDKKTSENSSKQIELPYVAADGSSKWSQIRLTADRDKAGKVTGLTGTLIDITRKKRTEASLERLQTTLRNSRIGTWTLNESTDELQWDDQMYAIYGIYPSESINNRQAWIDRLHPDDQHEVTEKISANLDENGRAISQFRIIRPDGSTRYLLAITFVATDPIEGTIYRFGFNQDITKQKQTEHALIESQSNFESMLKNVPGVVFRSIFYHDGRLEVPYASDQVRELYGVEPEQFIREPLLSWRQLHPDDYEPTKRYVLERVHQAEEMQMEFRILHPTKSVRWLQSFARRTPGFSDDASAWDCITVDITEQKNTEERLRIANDELARATQMKDQFLANVSHELRTPLSTILTTNSCIERGIFGPVHHKMVEPLGIMRHSGLHLLSLINDVLDLSKIESGRFDLDFSSIDLDEICADCLQFVKRDADEKGVSLALELDSNEPMHLHADERRLRQILINLLGNAVKFTPAGGSAKLKVFPLVREDNGWMPRQFIRFEISDSGIGIANEDFESIFLPFVQLDSKLDRSYAGTGLGLSLVKQLTELHAGHVSVSSEPGKGSSFAIDLPRQPLSMQRQTSPFATADRGHTSKPTNRLPASVNTGKPTILIADDDRFGVVSITAYLRSIGYSVDIVADGAAAIDYVKDQQPDLVLMDIQMPVVDGLSAIKQIRRLPQVNGVPIIATTGLAMHGDADRCRLAGANEYLGKPFELDRLTEMIERLRPRASLQ